MSRLIQKDRAKIWAKRYVPAEILATAGALLAAWIVYMHTHSFAAAAASGWVGEGIGFYGYFITTELLFNTKRYRQFGLVKRLQLVIKSTGGTMLVEFAPAEIIDTLLIRPLAMFVVPQHVHPYPVGFLVGKFSADIVFYAMAIIGFEVKSHWFRPKVGTP